ncbi:LysR substrate-binding domain-containing protein [Dichotomicrobium thermohalophilum]|uniref:LysR family transcriptional regulator n=1 Tax=Dichotomicrobium thermohalophilum TaxID=933063 RepID=A0A397Q7Y4_9HYPH|nr:LysR substrate-binding domain-containing protein [Dichotomicrobium thermohalophilum]RIA55617.1 LysR family transcriptional regulator [Dichotomicrobium thermohalophilum]
MADTADKAAPVRVKLSLNELEAFVAVVEQGSFSRAALWLGLSQPTVSQRVQMLEASCGLRLLDRAHGVRLTASGREIYNKARAVLAGARDIEATAQELGALARGRLKVGFSTPSVAMRVLAQLKSAHKAVEISTRQGNTVELLQMIAACEIDVGVMTLLDVPEGVRAELIAPQRPLLCVAADSPLARRRTVTLAELADQTLILREDGSLTRQVVETACRDAGLTLRAPLVMPTREAVKEAAAAGLGVGVVLSGEMGSDTRLAALEITDCTSAGGVYAVGLSETEGLPLIDAFFDACAQADLDNAEPTLSST